MQSIKKLGLLIMVISLMVIGLGMPVMAAAYGTMDAMLAAINNGTAVKYTDTVKFGKYGTEDLQWIYMGRYSDTVTQPYFIMTPNSAGLNVGGTAKWIRQFDSSSKYWAGSDLQIWLNSEFKTTYFNTTDQNQIYTITIPLLEYQQLGETSYSNSWWLNWSMSDKNRVRVVGDNGSWVWIYPGDPAGVRPMFFLKPEALPNDVIKFDGSTDLKDESKSGGAAINITCESKKEGGLIEAKYEWSTSETKPTTNWTTFTGNSVTVTQSVVGTWYLHVSCTDAFGHETYVKKKYTITAVGSTGLTQQDKENIRDLVINHSTIIGTNNSANEAAANTIYEGHTAAYWAYQSYLLAQSASTKAENAYDAANEARNALRKKAIKAISGYNFTEVVYDEISGTDNGVTATPATGYGYSVLTGVITGSGIQRATFTSNTDGQSRGIIFNVIAAPKLGTVVNVMFQ